MKIVRKNHYALVGRILCKTKPEIASAILEEVNAGEETDNSRIFFYYSRFSGLERFYTKETMQRRVFIAAMLKLFHPYVFAGKAFIVGHCFSKNIASCFHCKREAVQRNIQEAVIAYQAYDDFKFAVDESLKALKSEDYASA